MNYLLKAKFGSFAHVSYKIIAKISCGLTTYGVAQFKKALGIKVPTGRGFDSRRGIGG